MPYLNDIRTPNRTLARLSKAQEQEVHDAWDDYNAARTAFALSRTRGNYDRLKQAGADILDFQERMGVWLIHPANAGPGLLENDPRIIAGDAT